MSIIKTNYHLFKFSYFPGMKILFEELLHKKIILGALYSEDTGTIDTAPHFCIIVYNDPYPDEFTYKLKEKYIGDVKLLNSINLGIIASISGHIINRRIILKMVGDIGVEYERLQ